MNNDKRITYICSCLLFVVVHVTSDARIRSLVRGLELTNHKLASDFICGDVIEDGYADVILIPKDFG